MTKTKLKTIVLLDSHAILHRGYHAMQGFATRDGRPTGALYGFMSMVLKIYKDIKPDYIAACFDLPKPTFRHLSYDGYKAGRQKTDDALVSQIEESYELCEALSIPVYKCEGFEADDLLGTIAKQLSEEGGYKVIVASGDMDTLQLVTSKVNVLTPKKGNDTVLYNEEKVKERFGFPPKNIPDYKGLAGDNSDNIIGIQGIGDKTATELIKKYGSIENIYKTLNKDRNILIEDGFKERVVTLLENGEEEAMFSKTLATIRRDAPIEYKKEENTWFESVDKEKYKKLCEKYEFRSLANKLDEISGTKVEEYEEEIEKEKLEELKVMTNLLHSEMTNPSLGDIRSFTGKETYDEMKNFLVDKLKKENLYSLYEDVEKKIMKIILDMESSGIKVSAQALKKLSDELHKRVKSIEEEVYEKVGETFNISSPKQLGEILYEKLGLGSKIKKTKTGAKSTNIKELEKLEGEHEVIPLIMEYRELTKMLSTYIDLLPNYIKEDGKIHAHFVQTGAGTGRFSCEDPNLQNLPVKSEFGEKIKGAFLSDEGMTLISCDYAQIDLRSAAILSQDKNLVEIFEKGIDVHTGTAARVFGVKEEKVTPEMRRKAKAINFGILYGMGVTSLKESMKVERKEAQEFFDQYKFTFTRLMEYLEEVKADAWKKGYTETILGRRREVPLLKSPLPFLRAQGERIAINAPIQGTSADILKLAMIDVDEYIKENNLEKKLSILLQIHDELIFEVKDEIKEKVEKDLIKILENVLKKRKLSDLPLEVSSSSGKSLGSL